MDFETDIRRVVADAFNEDEIRELLQIVARDLELAVGTILAADLTDQQLDEFEALLASGEEDAARLWLEENQPNYKSVVRQQFNRILDRLARANA